uniref:DUF148 domain-containing protein n=1 Tax=Steinernema glaseri TaxID=37863 RepID=A0A1I7Y4Z3_9BILA
MATGSVVTRVQKTLLTKSSNNLLANVNKLDNLATTPIEIPEETEDQERYSEEKNIAIRDALITLEDGILRVKSALKDYLDAFKKLDHDEKKRGEAEYFEVSDKGTDAIEAAYERRLDLKRVAGVLTHKKEKTHNNRLRHELPSGKLLIPTSLGDLVSGPQKQGPNINVDIHSVDISTSHGKDEAELTKRVAAERNARNFDYLGTQYPATRATKQLTRAPRTANKRWDEPSTNDYKRNRQRTANNIDNLRK